MYYKNFVERLKEGYPGEDKMRFKAASQQLIDKYKNHKNGLQHEALNSKQ